MTTPVGVVFLIDCDNTVLDNDLVEGDLREHIAREFGSACGDRYRAIVEELRAELGCAHYLGALQRLIASCTSGMNALRDRNHPGRSWS